MNEPHAFDEAVQAFRSLLKAYRFQEDVESVIAVIRGAKELTETDNSLIALYAKKWPAYSARISPPRKK